MAIGLLVLIAAGAQLAVRAIRASSSSDATLIAQLDAVMPAPRPFGLVLENGATLASGDRILRLRPSAEAGEPALAEVVLSLPTSRAEALRPFQGLPSDAMETARKLEEWEREPTDEVVETARGDLEWDAWRAPYVRKRALHADGTWSEATAVHLTTHERSLVLTVLWRAGTEPNEQELRRVLSAVALSTEEPEPTSSAASPGASE